MNYISFANLATHVALSSSNFKKSSRYCSKWDKPFTGNHFLKDELKEERGEVVINFLGGGNQP